MAAQQAGIDGQNNIIVQIAGDNNAVNLKGLAHLTLTRYLTRRHIETDVDLLSPYSRSIPLVGRDGGLSALRGWLANGKPISIRVLTGRAGSGKTRLALELCEQMLGEGWDAGFLESGELERFRAQQNLATWGWQRPTLIVSDYAAVHAERLNGWFQELADNQGDPKKPLRLLLLERNAEAGSGWWQTAFGRGGFGARAVQRLLDPGEPIPLMPMVASNDRRSVIGEILKRAESAERPPEEGADQTFDRQLAELTWGGEPLFLMMAGLMARDVGMANVLSLGRTDLAFALAERELARIAKIGKAKGLDPDFMEVMAAYVTLCRGLDPVQIRIAVPTEQEALGLPSAGDPGVIANVLCDALPGANGADPILPDVIGEAAILKAFSQHYDDSNVAVVRAFGLAGAQVSAVGQREAALAPAQEAVDLYRELAAKAPDAYRPALASALNNLAIFLSEGGQREEALAPAQEAADLYRALAAETPDAWRPDLASALNNVAIRLSELGRRREALAPAQEAASLYRALAAKAPDAWGPGLASVLNSLAICLSEVGQRREALAPAREAADLYHELAAKAPDAYRPDLASALNNLANCQSNVGQRPEALAAAREAVVLYEELTGESPDAYRPRLAMALKTLAVRLSEVGQREAALAPAQEAADLYRALAAKAPDAYRPDLASALNNLASRLSEVGQRQEALAPCQEAADLYRALAAEAPDAWRPGLAMALNNLAIFLSEGGQREEALAPAQEAADLYRALAVQAPDAYLPALASALSTLASSLGGVGRREAALAPAQEAVDLNRALAVKAPDAWQPDLAMALNNLAIRLSAVGQREAALAPAQEAADLYRALAAKAPDAYRPDLGLSLSVMADRLEETDRNAEAVEADEEAIGAIAPYFAAHPQAFAHRMMPIARAYLRRCEKLAREPDAELLTPILEVLERMQAASGDEG